MKRIWLLILCFIAVLPLRADEGMWLLPLLQQQKIGDMQALGLQLNAKDIYDPEGVSLKDAVVHFGGGCTGEIISSEGLVLTNHHCGYSSIQMHSTPEHDYLTDGFWAMSKQNELPNPGLTVTLIDRIEDVTDYVMQSLREGGDSIEALFLSQSYLNKLANQKAGESMLKSHPEISAEIKAFFGGNKYYMFIKKTYRDIRLVGAPPSAIGKFGGETDNWSWPRQTCDFSLFRIYADAQGNPADYSESNVPLHPKRWLSISMSGVNENDYVMMIGFPGRTNRYFTSWEVAEKQNVENRIIIEMRALRQDAMLEEMNRDRAIRIMYANKYSSSANGYKRSKGSNRAIELYHLEQAKKQEQDRLLEYARTSGKTEYSDAVQAIEQIVSDRRYLLYQKNMLDEAIFRGVEFATVPIDVQPVIDALRGKDKAEKEKQLLQLKGAYLRFADRNYSAAVDRKVSKVMIKAYHTKVYSRLQPEVFAIIDKKFKGDVDKYVEYLFKKSIYGSPSNFAKFMKHPSAKKLENDPMILFAKSVDDKRHKIAEELSAFTYEFAEAERTYIRGIMEVEGADKLFPDANSSIRVAYGKVTGFTNDEGKTYKYFSTLDEVIEKEDTTNSDFIVPARLKELYASKDFGGYAASDGKVHACFMANTHSTGGNSGSPVMNSKGALVGINFDRTWEGVGGDILYNADQQRSIIADIRYILFVVDQYAHCHRLIDELTIDK